MPISDRRRADDVGARHQAVQPEFSKIVRHEAEQAAAADRRQLPLTVRQILIPHRLHANARERLAELVGDASGDDAAARQREVDLLDDLRICRRRAAARFRMAAAVRTAARRIRFA